MRKTVTKERTLKFLYESLENVQKRSDAYFKLFLKSRLHGSPLKKLGMTPHIRALLASNCEHHAALENAIKKLESAA